MAILTYSDLQTAIQSWTERSDITTANIQDFIALAEADLRVRAELAEWDAETTLTLTSGSASLPSDFGSAKSVKFSGSDFNLTYKTPEQFKDYSSSSPSGTPSYYTIIGSDLRVTPTTSGSISLFYSARFSSLSVSAPTNSLLTLFPDAYLYGSLCQHAIFAKDDAALARYGNLYAGSGFSNAAAPVGGALQRVRAYTRGKRLPSGPLKMVHDYDVR